MREQWTPRLDLLLDELTRRLPRRCGSPTSATSRTPTSSIAVSRPSRPRWSGAGRGAATRSCWSRPRSTGAAARRPALARLPGWVTASSMPSRPRSGAVRSRDDVESSRRCHRATPAARRRSRPGRRIPSSSRPIAGTGSSSERSSASRPRRSSSRAWCRPSASLRASRTSRRERSRSCAECSTTCATSRTCACTWWATPMIEPLRASLAAIYGDNEGLSRERAGEVAEHPAGGVGAPARSHLLRLRG